MDTKSVAEKAVRDRVERGMDLYRSGAVSKHGDAYVVQGTARAYTVFLSAASLGVTARTSTSGAETRV